jgi:hypothetical protein
MLNIAPDVNASRKLSDPAGKLPAMKPYDDSQLSAKLSAPARVDPPLVAGEKEMLLAYLDFHRETIALKCAGVPPDKASEALVPPSDLTLHGLVRHLAGCEQWWLHQQFAGEQVEPLFAKPEDDFGDLSDPFEDSLALWRAQCEHSRRIVEAASLDDTGTRIQTGEAISLRRILLLLIADYARHCGHADLLRERIDGAVGW